MDSKKVKEVLELLKNKHEDLDALQESEGTAKEALKVEIAMMEKMLTMLGIEFELRSCYKCGEPETAAHDVNRRYICWDCMMEN